MQDLQRDAARFRLMAEARRARLGLFRTTRRRAAEEVAAISGPPRHGRRETELQQATLFRGLPRKDLALLARRASPVSWPAGSVLADERNPARQFVVLTSGVAEQTMSGTRVGVVTPGDHFGELTVLDGTPLAATVTALSDVEGFVLTRREFWSVLRESPALSMRLAASLAEHLRRAERRLAAMSKGTVTRIVKLEPDPLPVAAGDR